MINIFFINSTENLNFGNYINIVDDVKKSDFIYLNYKIRSKESKIKFVDETNVPIISNALALAKQNNKKLVYLCGGDVPPKILPNNNNIIVLNTSVSRSNKPNNEIVIPPIVDDKFKFYLNETKLSIGFVGQKMHDREKYLNYLESINDIETNFIIRDTYIHKLKNSHILDFENNMNNNLFTFCYRGRGNFSVRFYETLMRGRIPIVIKTDNIFPYEDEIDYKKIGIFIEEEELNDNNKLDDIIKNFYFSKTNEELIQMQKHNREIYLNYFKSDIFHEKLFSYIYSKLNT